MNDGSDLYHRTLAYDYGDADRSRLMAEVWSVTPWMVNVFTDNINGDRERNINDWCRSHFGDEAHPIHGRPGSWQRGGATIYGWTWYGFISERMMDEFCALWCPPEGIDAEDS